MTKLFLDDTRHAPDFTWDVVRSYDEFVAYITKNGMPDIISFDHDLAFEHYPFNDSSFGYCEPPREIPYHRYTEKTGYDCAKWLCENGLKPKQWLVHSMNPTGKANIIQLLSNPRNFNGEKNPA